MLNIFFYMFDNHLLILKITNELKYWLAICKMINLHPIFIPHR